MLMNLTTFLSNLTQVETIPQQKVWLFVGQAYPLFFFSAFLRRCKHIGDIHRIDVASYSKDSLATLLNISFLGMFHTYWFGDCTTLEKNLREFIYSYLEHYVGPHRVMIFASVPFKHSEHCLVIDVDQKIDKEIYQFLGSFIGEESTQDADFVDELFNHVRELTLDQVYLLSEYQRVVGRRSALFFAQWLDKIVVPERSLFNLSQQFFTKNMVLFLQQWQIAKNNYSDEFWSVFWAEQLWQALWFVLLMRNGQHIEARTYARRLPFSFTQRDWQRYSFQELAKAHTQLYTIDYAIKNGGSVDALELFFFQFAYNGYAH